MAGLWSNSYCRYSCLLSFSGLALLFLSLNLFTLFIYFAPPPPPFSLSLSSPFYWLSFSLNLSHNPLCLPRAPLAQHLPPSDLSSRSFCEATIAYNVSFLLSASSFHTYIHQVAQFDGSFSDTACSAVSVGIRWMWTPLFTSVSSSLRSIWSILLLMFECLSFEQDV